MVQELCQQRLLFEYHYSGLAGHPGAEGTLQALQERFYWPQMGRQVEEYVKTCKLYTCCKRFRSHQCTNEAWYTPTYHPQANPTERRNQEIRKGYPIQREESSECCYWADA